MRAHDLIVVGASAGGVEALRRLVADLPPDLRAGVVVVLHLAPGSASGLPAILDRSGTLGASHARDREQLHQGHVYVAPPDRHVVVSDGELRLTLGPRENLSRPAIDPLFRSAAREHGPHVIGVVLSGLLDDGSAGLLAIRQAGGVAVVQEPEDALYPDMPRHALALAGADHVARIADMGRLLGELSRGKVKPMAGTTEPRVTPAEGGLSGEPPGHPSAFSCPECGGVLWEADGNGALRFECRVGHAYGSESLAADETGKIEEALWAALRAVEERAALSRRLATRAREHRQRRSADRFDEQVAEHDRAAIVLRELIGAPPSRATLRARARERIVPGHGVG